MIPKINLDIVGGMCRYSGTWDLSACRFVGIHLQNFLSPPDFFNRILLISLFLLIIIFEEKHNRDVA